MMKQLKTSVTGYTAALLSCLVLLGGCSRITAENYAKINVGMSQQNVEAILGKPDECSGIKTLVLSAQKCSWSSGTHDITISFMAEKVVAASANGL